MNYVAWALLGMAAYSTVTLLTKLSVRTGEFNSWGVVAIATAIVMPSLMTYAVTTGAFAGKTVSDFTRPGALWAYACGVALLIAVASLFKGLSMGPASVVVPVYGMFIIGGAVLGVVFLGEPVTAKKVAGLALCVAGVYLVAT